MRKTIKKAVLSLLLILAIGVGIYSLILGIVVETNPDVIYKREETVLQLPALDAESRAEAEALERRYGRVPLNISCKKCVTITNGQGKNLRADPKKGLSGDLPVYSATLYGKSYEDHFYFFELVVCGSDQLTVEFDGRRGGKLTVSPSQSPATYQISSAHLGQVCIGSDGRVQIVDDGLFGASYEIMVADVSYDWFTIEGRIKGTAAFGVATPNSFFIQGDCKKWQFTTYDGCQWIEETMKVPETGRAIISLPGK